jgi:hypothetical protein
MVVTRYKPLFSFTASYELAGLGVLTEGIQLETSEVSYQRMRDKKLLAHSKDNTVTVFYEGIEKPSVNPLTSEPVIEIDDEEYFYFKLEISGKGKLKGLKFHTTADRARENGFPVLYDALIAVNGGPAQVTTRDDIKVVSPVFTFAVENLPLNGIAGDHATLEIRDEKNQLADLGISPAKLNDKAIDGVDAKPEFSFSIDASQLEAGIYEFKVGNFRKKFFIAPGINLDGAVSVIRVLKNDFLPYKKDLADNSFADFRLLIPKA